MSNRKYRLVTRSDFDGLVCAVLLKHLEMIEDIKFVHPKDMQDGKIDIGPRDITTNLPYVPTAHLVFDHHLSETLRNEAVVENHIIDPDAPSAARVVYEYYGGSSRFPAAWQEMMRKAAEARPPKPLDSPLTDRELDILNGVAAGLSNQEIAEQSHVSLSTVKTHLRNIYGKLEVKRRTQAVERARQLQLLR